MSILSAILSALHKTIHSKTFFNDSLVNPSAFSRQRVLGFVQMVALILCCAKTSLPSTLRSFLVGLLDGKKSCTRQAFSKRRSLIKPEAFQTLFQLSARMMTKYTRPPKDRLRILAVDGTRVNLPTHPELVEAYGIQKSTGNLPQALVSTLYDVENRYALDVQIRPHDGNEREMARRHIETIQSLGDVGQYLIIFDRGYPSGELLQTVTESEGYFLMRCPTEFLKGVKQVKDDAWITHKFHSVRQALTFRVIHAELPNGAREILCTNLPNTCTASEIVDLYAYRWRIEISYDFLKNRVQLENLSGITLCAFLQQLYASLLMCNLCGAYYCDNRAWECDADTVPVRRLRLRENDVLTCNRRINMATVLAAIREILPKALVPKRVRLSPLVRSIDARDLKNILRYDKNDRCKPRLRKHPSVKFTQSQRAGV